MRWTTALLMWSALGLAPGVAAGQTVTSGPTFDCAQAKSQVETLICSDAELAVLDRQMAEVYAAAMENYPKNIAAEQRAFQRGWISGRNECWKSEDPRACTVREYRTRIVELQITSGQFMATTPVDYACAGNPARPFTVVFYRDTVPSSAVITYGDDQVITFAAPAASGTRYTAANVEFWEHQGEAAVEWFGSRLTCRVRKATAPPWP